MTIRIKNWSKHQHFKDRTPPWIKLYRDILDDPDWHELDSDAAKVLVSLWLLASEDPTHTGSLPDIRRIAFRLRIKESALKHLLDKLNSWLIRDDIETISDRYRGDAPERAGEETETETETYKPETETKTSRAPRFDAQAHLVSIGVDASIAADWLSHRKAKKATVSLTVIDGIKSEAAKARIALSDALAMCCQRGWTGFKAEWVAESIGYKPPQAKTPSPENFATKDYGTGGRL